MTRATHGSSGDSYSMIAVGATGDGGHNKGVALLKEAADVFGHQSASMNGWRSHEMMEVAAAALERER